MAELFRAHCPEIECDGCAGSIRRSLGGVDGVEAVDVDVEAKQVTVRYDPARTGDAALRDRLVKAGFEPDPAV